MIPVRWLVISLLVDPSVLPPLPHAKIIPQPLVQGLVMHSGHLAMLVLIALVSFDAASDASTKRCVVIDNSMLVSAKNLATATCLDIIVPLGHSVFLPAAFATG